jgi:hypothetical protein
MVRIPKAPGIAVRRLILTAACAAFSTGVAYAQEAPPPKKNSWEFVAGATNTRGWLYVIIKPQADGWAIASLGREAPPDIAKDSPLEPFIVSPDFQQWSNYYADNIGNCDSFGVRNSPSKTVCSSALIEKPGQHSVARILLGKVSSGKRYDAGLVNASINSIDPADALLKLEAIERQAH